MDESITEKVIQIMIHEWNLPEGLVREFLKKNQIESNDSLDNLRSATENILQNLILETETL